MKYGKYIIYITVLYNLIFVSFLWYKISIKKELILNKLSSINYNLPSYEEEYDGLIVSQEIDSLVNIQSNYNPIDSAPNRFYKKEGQNSINNKSKPTKKAKTNETIEVFENDSTHQGNGYIEDTITTFIPVIVSEPNLDPIVYTPEPIIYRVVSSDGLYYSLSHKKHFITLEIPMNIKSNIVRFVFFNDTPDTFKVAKREEIRVTPGISIDFPFGKKIRQGESFEFPVKFNSLNQVLDKNKTYEIIIPTTIKGRKANILHFILELELK